jgi:DNA-binding transcriptional MerR regulator
MSSTAQESVTADMAERILDADFKNIVKKVAGGKTLTVAERARIQARAAGCTDSVAYAKTVVELASLLGVTRRTITTWQKLEGAPKALTNGDFPVSEWREFVRLRGLKTNQPVTTNEEALKARKLLAEVEERELKVGIKKGEFVLLAEVRRSWLTQVGKAIALLRAKFENELPPILSGRDAQGIREECARAIDEVCRGLHTGEGAAP